MNFLKSKKKILFVFVIFALIGFFVYYELWMHGQIKECCNYEGLEYTTDSSGGFENRVEKSFYKDGSLRGILKTKNWKMIFEKKWYKNGILEEYKSYDDPNFFTKKWYENGELKYYEKWTDDGTGNPKRVWEREWYSNGQLMWEQYGWGNPTRYWDFDGREIPEEEFYKNKKREKLKDLKTY